MKLAYADVKAYDGDPRFGKIPVEQLLSKEFAREACGADRSGACQLHGCAGRAGDE